MGYKVGQDLDVFAENSQDQCLVRVFKFAFLSWQLSCITRWQISDGPAFTDQTLKSCMRFAYVLSDGLGRTNARLSVKTGPTWRGGMRFGFARLDFPRESNVCTGC